MSDVECPYCGNGQDICNDDGHGLDECRTHQEECGECGKMFIFTTSLTVDSEAEKADCLNGSEHRMEPRQSWRYYYPDAVRCSVCNHEEKGRYKPPPPVEIDPQITGKEP